MLVMIHFFSSSDDQLEDSDSDEHSRSESVTGMKFVISNVCGVKISMNHICSHVNTFGVFFPFS